jgi:hypothetical protein
LVAEAATEQLSAAVLLLSVLFAKYRTLCKSFDSVLFIHCASQLYLT